MKLIDADKLLGLMSDPMFKEGFRETMKIIIKNTPTVDAVPVVRCGECAKHQSPNCAAKHEQALMDFCSHGVRKPERSNGE